MITDLRYAFRMLLKSPGFTLIAILTLALGIGANTAIFSVVNAVLLKALPYHEADRIVLVWGDSSKENAHRSQVSSTDVADWRARNHVFSAISTYGDFRPVLSGQGEPERIFGAQVGDDFFKVMGDQPLLGRVFNASEQQEGKDRVVVLGYGLWQQRFAADPSVVGKTLSLSGRTYIVIGVMAQGFRSLPVGLLEQKAEFYRPVAEPPNEKERSSRHLRAIARLKPGVTLAQAQTEMNLITRQLAQEHPDADGGLGVHLVSLRDDLVSPARPALLLLFGAVAFLLLIACTNIANLLLARSMGRSREIAIRAALGAGRGRLVRQVLTESLVLAAVGGLAGLLVALWGTTALEQIGTHFYPLLGKIALDGPVLAFSFGISLCAGLLFGCAPAWRAAHLTLNDAGRSPGAAATRSPLRTSLVAIEVALAMTLLIGAGLLLRTVQRLQAVDPGFKAERLVTMNVWLPGAKYPKEGDAIAFYDKLRSRIVAVPGVSAVGLTSIVPAGKNFDQRTIEIEGQPRGAGEQPNVDNYVVTPGYLRAMTVPLLAGRVLQESDHAQAPLAVLVSNALARKFWPNESAIGKRICFFGGDGAAPQPWRTVVGVVGDVKQYGLDTAGTAALYVPLPQMPNSAMTLVVRSQVDPAAMVPTLRHEILALDPDEAVFNVATMEQLLSDSTALRRFSMFLLALFAGLALLLAAIGLYGVISYSVVQRTRELGIRIALGAKRSDILGLVVRQGMSVVALGLAGGLVASFLLTRLMAGLLFGVSPTDPATFVLVAIALAAVALVACLFPARRANVVDPAVALRSE
jgi:putative ABC transport system permease protein